MNGLWSAQIEARYALRLSEDVRAWLDGGLWREAGGAEFCRARTPEQLLDPEPGALWAGFMLPDTLPLVGNDYGDWLCLRIATDGSVSEVLHWSHCGGDWIPFGRTLAEALLYDAAVHVIFPERPSFSGSETTPRNVFGWAHWASTQLSHGADRVRLFWNTRHTRAEDRAAVIWKVFAEAGLSEYAICRDRIVGHLESPLKLRGDASLARQLNVTWEPEFVRWLFDTGQIPEPARQQLVHLLGSQDGDLFAQDWSSAEQQAVAVTLRREDLGWAWDIAGWAAERRGELRLAVDRYLAGMRTSWFSDDALRLRTHWFDEGFGKFAASRLAALASYLTPAERRDPYLSIFLDNDGSALRRRVENYWLGLAREAMARGAHAEAYQLYYRAGWDLGLLPVSAYHEVFEGLRRAAAAAGSPPLAALAQLHHRFLA